MSKELNKKAIFSLSEYTVRSIERCKTYIRYEFEVNGLRVSLNNWAIYDSTAKDGDLTKIRQSAFKKALEYVNYDHSKIINPEYSPQEDMGYNKTIVVFDIDGNVL